MSQHPEQRVNETFIGNRFIRDGKIQLHLISLKTIRIGEVAYDIHGELITGYTELFPVFINVSESRAYDRILLELKKIHTV